MQRSKRILLPVVLCVSCLLQVAPVLATRDGKVPHWSTRTLNMSNVRACAFGPTGREIAFVYLTGKAVSGKPWMEQYTAHLALWHFETGRVEEKFSWTSADRKRNPAWAAATRYLRFADHGRRLIALDSEAIRVFDTSDYTEVGRVPIELPPYPMLKDPNHWGWQINGLSVAPDGSRAAISISDGLAFYGGFVRVYNLPSGKLIRQWRLSGGYQGVAAGVEGVALSPDGRRVAVSWLPCLPSSDPERFIAPRVKNVLVLDVQSGATITGVSTKYIAGPVLFGPHDTLVTGSINSDRRGYKHDSVKIWNARTGQLLREITNHHAGVHYRLKFSSHGRFLLGYTGTEKPVENFVNVSSQQFEVWDFATGTVVAVSPKILPIQLVPPRLQLSPKGKFVVVWEGGGRMKPVVYKIPWQ